ncbi:MAG TPA: hypothetical protein PLP61_16255 [Nocardioides sp.]|uniref:hypothetical protein n=1 Tax=Nocardioides sp. TaxID=35761 RepID=UPI002C566BC9|nr:hypothetical protein [Nocardioides sp.]HQR28598.1 hypothetical protein [Nocardioides sp.]
MISRTAACVSGILGGACWILHYLLSATGLADAGGNLGVVLKWAGATWLILALVGAGVGLVRRAPLWLKVVVGVAVPLLALTLLSLLYGPLSRLVAEALFGLVVLVGSVVLLRRGAKPVAETA